MLAQTLGLAAAGVAGGLFAAWMLGRLMEGLLFEVTPSDPVTYAGVLAVLTVAAVVAGYLPASRASRVDPAIALRAE